MCIGTTFPYAAPSAPDAGAKDGSFVFDENLDDAFFTKNQDLFPTIPEDSDDFMDINALEDDEDVCFWASEAETEASEGSAGADSGILGLGTGIEALGGSSLPAPLPLETALNQPGLHSWASLPPLDLSRPKALPAPPAAPVPIPCAPPKTSSASVALTGSPTDTSVMTCTTKGGSISGGPSLPRHSSSSGTGPAAEGHSSSRGGHGGHGGRPKGPKGSGSSAQPPKIRVIKLNQRVNWTSGLHGAFVSAVRALGGADKATPKTIMVQMGIKGLKVHHIKSHLQKYRRGVYQDFEEIIKTPSTRAPRSAAPPPAPGPAPARAMALPPPPPLAPPAAVLLDPSLALASLAAASSMSMADVVATLQAFLQGQMGNPAAAAVSLPST